MFRNKKLRLILLGLLLLMFFGVYSLAKTTSRGKLATAQLPVSKLIQIPEADHQVEKNIPPVNLTDALAADRASSNEQRVPILMYHHVGELLNQDPITKDLTVSSADFEQQVQYFKALGYHTVTIRQVYESLHDGVSLPARPLVFTFDDGYKDVFLNAVPILEKYGYTGTFAIATELLGRPTYAVWDDVLAARAHGMEIVSHTENHLDLISPRYSEADLTREIFDSKKVLEAKMGQPIDFFVYPYGHFNVKVEQLVKDAGYKMALTTEYGTEIIDKKLLAEPRVRVHGQDGLEKLKKIFSGVMRNAVVAPSH